jgi:glycosyltransferase involved in cell wall biosynthesis
MRTYWTAHKLAARGHEVEVVTNAREATAPFRMFMRAQDWQRCVANYGAGRVAVHWTDPVDRAQAYLPMASPFVSKLAGLAARVHSERPFDIILSHYMEPYGVAGHLAAQIVRVPHVVRMAGSDAGRLWRHPQLEPLYDHVLRSAQAVIATGAVAERATARGVDPGRIVSAGGIVVPEDLFAPLGPALDLGALRQEVQADPDFRGLLWGEFEPDRPYFGICGKLGERKGSFALLAAMEQLKHAGLDVGLVALAHGRPETENDFRATVRKLGLVNRVLQIPFLPHWRVPEFLRGCLAVCCLEQDFPITFHTPIIPLEVLLCGRCLVGSTEVIRKLPNHGRLPHGYGCVAIEDVNDVEALGERLGAIVRNPAPAVAVGARGCAFARKLQRENLFPHTLERILEIVVSSHPKELAELDAIHEATDMEADHRFPLTRIATTALAQTDGEDEQCEAIEGTIDLPLARAVLSAIKTKMRAGRPGLASLASAVHLEIAIADAESEPVVEVDEESADALFALRITEWALADGELPRLIPVRDPRARILEFSYDVSAFHGARTVADLPSEPTPGPSYIVAFAGQDDAREPLLIDRRTTRILKLSDGSRTVAEILERLKREQLLTKTDDELAWIEGLFVGGLVRLMSKQDGVSEAGKTL